MRGAKSLRPVRGRTREQAILLALVSDAREGRGGSVVLAGGAGTGKTTLLAAARSYAPDMSVMYLVGGKSGPDRPYGVLEQLIRQNQALRPAFASVARAISSHPADPVAIPAAFVTALRVTATDRPLLCCIDDLHRLDQPTLDVLTFAARRLGDSRVAMVLATRGDPGDYASGVPSTRLQPLDLEVSREVMFDRGPPELAPDVATELAIIAEGNARAVVDLAESLTLPQARGEARRPTAVPKTSLLRREHEERYAALPADTRWLVLLLAADPELDVVGLLAAMRLSGLDEAALEPAERAHFVRVEGGEVLVPPAQLRAVVYDAASPTLRRAAHRHLAKVYRAAGDELRHHLHRAAGVAGRDERLAQTLAECAAGEGVAADLASRTWEWSATLMIAPAATSFRIQAARSAWAAGQPHRARLLLQQVMARPVSPPLEAQVRLLLGEIELRTGSNERARASLLAAIRNPFGDRVFAVQAMAQAAEASMRAGDYGGYTALARDASALRSADEPPPERLRQEQFAGMAAVFEGRLADAAGHLRAVLALAVQLDDDAALMQGCVAAMMLGDDERAYRLAVRAAVVARAAGNAARVPLALELASASDFSVGRYDTSTVALTEGLRLAQETGQASMAALLTAALALNEAIMGNKEAANTYLAQARKHAAPDGMARTVAVIEWTLGMLDLVDGHSIRALARLRRVLGDGSKGQLVLGVAATPHLVEAAAGCQELEVARGPFAIFERWALTTDNPSWLALVGRCRALLADDPAVVEQRYRESLQFHEKGESEFERARTELLFGQFLRRQQSGESRQYFRRALGTFEKFHATAWTRLAAQALRSSRDGLESSLPSVAAALTDQQRQIARMVVDGATNRQVAEQLWLSVRTVDHHLRSIYARLGIKSRNELASLVRRDDPST